MAGRIEAHREGYGFLIPDEGSWVADCVVCMTPMVVWRTHGLPTPRLEAALPGHGPQLVQPDGLGLDLRCHLRRLHAYISINAPNIVRDGNTKTILEK